MVLENIIKMNYVTSLIYYLDVICTTNTIINLIHLYLTIAVSISLALSALIHSVLCLEASVVMVEDAKKSFCTQILQPTICTLIISSCKST